MSSIKPYQSFLCPPGGCKVESEALDNLLHYLVHRYLVKDASNADHILSVSLIHTISFPFVSFKIEKTSNLTPLRLIHNTCIFLSSRVAYTYSRKNSDSESIQYQYPFLQ